MIRLVLIVVASLFFIKATKAALPEKVVHKSGQEFTLCSQQIITKAFFFDIVDVGLYYPDCSDKRSIFDLEEKLLRFSYLRAVTGKQFKEGAEEYLKKNLSAEQYDKCMTSYARLNDSYLDVSDGDFYDLFQVNSVGLDLYLNSKPLASMQNKECESLYYNIWFGEYSMSSGFKDLLAKKPIPN